MTPILFRNARVVDPASGRDAMADLLVTDRQIAAIGSGLAAPADARIIEAAGRVLAPGLVDACAFRADPAACVAGGITHALLMPDQSPPLDDPALIERAERLGKPRLWVRPLAAATRGLDGLHLAELALLQEAGAVAVATGRAAIADADVMLRLLRYAAGLGLVTICHAEDPRLTHGAVATNGEPATRLGLPAAPAMAEPLQIARDLRLAREAGAAIHFACITTAEGAELVRRARAEGQNVSAATTPDYLLLNDMAVSGYRSFAHLSPPLRDEADRLALRAAVADGTIAIIASRHDPRTQEEKRQPFADAAPGAAGAATLLPLALTLLHDGLMELPALLHALTAAPAARFGLDAGALRVGGAADLILLDPNAPWRIDSATLPGLQGNTPFDGIPVSGRIDMVLKGGEVLGL